MARANSKPRKNEQKITQDRINELYRESGTSLAKMAASVGISPASLQNYTSGERTPDAQGIVKLCKAFNVSADWLLGLSDVKKPDTDLSAVCEYTGLSEKAVDNIRNITHRRPISALLENPLWDIISIFYGYYLDMEPQKSTKKDVITYMPDPSSGNVTLSAVDSASFFLAECSNTFSEIVKSDFVHKWIDKEV